MVDLNERSVGSETTGNYVDGKCSNCGLIIFKVVCVSAELGISSTGISTL